MTTSQIVKKGMRWMLRSYSAWRYGRFYRMLLKRNEFENRACPGEQEWKAKWSVLGACVNPVYYRLFYRYIGCDKDIVPEDICRDVIEPLLNPARFTAYYSDKNIFDRLFPANTLARTLLRKMDGIYYDGNYDRLDLDDMLLLKILNDSGFKRVIIKPAVSGMSGIGVRVFACDNDGWWDVKGGEGLTCGFLLRYYGDNFIMQECLEQSEYISQFNPTSVNTLRISLYCSVKTDEYVVTNSIMRIGGKDSVVDNAHAGGCYVGIRPDGTLCNRVLDQWGGGKTTFNGVDFKQEYCIPNFDEVVRFAQSVGRCVPHHRLLALDIMIDKEGKPRLIEFNVKAYSMWLFQFTTGAAFGAYTDEILDYCRERLDKVEYQLFV